ncbi:unnamed protein product, partial [Rotaria sp. Silwood1]
IIGSREITFNADRWKQLILNHFSQLEKFCLTYYDHMDNNNEFENAEQINQFSSTFSLNRKWIFHVQINRTDIIYMIYPYKKPWYDYIDNNIECSTAPHLTIGHNGLYLKTLFRRITRISTVTKIQHLEIMQKHIRACMLTKLMNQLPYLITLKLHSLSYEEEIKLTYTNLFGMFSFDYRNQITKVYIEQINVIDDFYNISRVCPRMIYFKTKYINNIDIQCFLRTILNKINNNSNCLRSLCFDIPTTDDEIIKNFDLMIRSEKLLFNYTIKRVYNKIHLQWK